MNKILKSTAGGPRNKALHFNEVVGIMVLWLDAVLVWPLDRCRTACVKAVHREIRELRPTKQSHPLNVLLIGLPPDTRVNKQHTLY